MAAGSPNPNPRDWLLNCTQGLPACARRNNCRSHGTPASNGQIVLSWARDPVAGPWAHRVILPPTPEVDPAAWNCHHNNPSAILNKTDGSVLLMYHGSRCSGGSGGEQLGLAHAAHWNDTTYVKRPGGAIVTPANGTGDHEDPFMWVDKRGRFHAMTHNQGKRNRCGGDVAGHTCGAHLFSRDSYTWSVSRSAVYGAEVRCIVVPPEGRERPDNPAANSFNFPVSTRSFPIRPHSTYSHPRSLNSNLARCGWPAVAKWPDYRRGSGHNWCSAAMASSARCIYSTVLHSKATTGISTC